MKFINLANKTRMVSVIIPTYNRSALLSETVKSILDQTYKNFEIIIVSDGSTDDTISVVEKFSDNRVKFVQLEKNYGYPAVARNRGLGIASGKYIAFCDDDDLWDPQKLEKQVEDIDRGFDFVFTDISYLQRKNKSISLVRTLLTKVIYNLLPRELSYAFLHITNWIPNSSVIVSKAVLGDSKFSEDRRYRASEDYELWLRILKGRKVYFIQENLVQYRVHDNNISNDKKDNLKRCALIFKEREVKGVFFRILNQTGYFVYKLRYLLN